ncbi:MAG: DNA polymerase domain-containing protein [Cetobacterium sp.]
MKNVNELFAYHWNIDPIQDCTKIRIYGILRKNEMNVNVCVRIDNFTPYVYIQLPDDRLETIAGVKEAVNQFTLYSEVMYKSHLYNFENKKSSNSKSPFLFCQCLTKQKIQKIQEILKYGIFIPTKGKCYLKPHETAASPILQMVSLRNLPMAGWIMFNDGKLVREDEKITSCDYEFIVKWKDLKKSNRLDQVIPKILAFDIEVNSEFINKFPDNRPRDAIFQISCVIESQERRKLLLSLKAYDMNLKKSELLNDVKVQLYENEEDLLLDFMRLIDFEKPNVITGFNIFGFDIEYIMKRCIRFCLSDELKSIGFNKETPAQIEKVKWTSSAYKNQEFNFLNWEGILLLDLLPLVRRDYKLDTYTLKNVTATFLNNDTKDPVTYKDIFTAYRTREKLDIVGKYCVQDSNLCIELIKHFNSWIALAEMAKVCNVSMFTLYTQGQQIKIYSQIYKYCLIYNIVVNSDGYQTKANERYTGAYVHDPIAGYYENVVPLDFCLTGDTLVSLSNGTSKQLNKLVTDHTVLGYSEENNGLGCYSSINGLQDKGERDTVQITLRDGRTIMSTPDHKFMLEDGTYCKAENLMGKKIKCGIEYTEDIVCELESDWKLSVSGYEFSMEDEKEREKTLVFARILGYVMADGSVYLSTPKGQSPRKFAEAYFGTQHDANNFIADMKIILGEQDIRRCGGRRRDPQSLNYMSIGCRKRTTSKGTCFYVTIPVAITNMLHDLEGMVIGKRSTQDMTLPLFLLEERCPKSVIREFLGGLFGGDGTAPCIRLKEGINSISFKWNSCNIDSMVIVFEQLKNMIERFEIFPTFYEPRESVGGNFVAKDISTNKRLNFILRLLKKDIPTFQDKIGFRYCINKSCKLFVASSYIKLQNTVREQYMFVIDTSNKIIAEKIPKTLARNNEYTFKRCVEDAHKELLKKVVVLDPVVFASTKNVWYRRGEEKRHPDTPKKTSLGVKKFITFKNFILEIGAIDWFSDSVHEKKYAVKSDDTFIPSLSFSVIDVRPAGKQQVFDIEVDKVHNFVANGVVVSNCSLYPSIMIAQNICYSTFANDDVPDADCNIFEWEDHIGCEHDPKVIEIKRLNSEIEKIDWNIKKLMIQRDSIKKDTPTPEVTDPQVWKSWSLAQKRKSIQKLIDIERKKQKPFRVERQELKKSKPTDREDDEGNKVSGIICAKRYYRFLKKEVKKGVIPTIIQNLLDSRKQVKELMKKADPIQKIVYDKEQLAYKVSANSMYGGMGVRRGYLPFMPGAMCVTYYGRETIKKTADIIVNKWKGQLIYIDTDSNYITFPNKTTTQEIWDYALKVAKEVSKEFPDSMTLEFENTIYKKFLILSKKRYMYQESDRDGNLNHKIGKKGVILARRDNSNMLKHVYEKLASLIFEKVPPSEIELYLIEFINDIFRNIIPYQDYVITKSIGEIENTDSGIEQKIEGRLGDYKVKQLPEDEIERKKILNGRTEKEYYVSCCPAQVQLAEKMRKRGIPVDAGSRIEFVVIRKPGATTLGERIEDYEYFKLRSRILRIDPEYYVHSLINPLDQMLAVGIGNNHFVKDQYDIRMKYLKVVNQINKLGRSKIIK